MDPAGFTQHLYSQTQSSGSTHATLTRCFSLSSPSVVTRILSSIIVAIPPSSPPTTVPRLYHTDDAAARRNVVDPSTSGDAWRDQFGAKIKFSLKDSRKVDLHGSIEVWPVTVPGGGRGSEILMLRAKGEPLEWTRLWRKIRDHPAMKQHLYDGRI